MAKAASTARHKSKDRPIRKTSAARRVLVRASLAVSLDGYIADKRGGVDWLNPFFSPEIDFDGFMRTIGAMVMGRKTFGDMRKLGAPPGAPARTIVFTRRSKSAGPDGVEFASNPAKIVERLRRELAGTGKDIWLMGGGQAIDAFHTAGLVDRFELSVIPVLLGQGVQLFPRHARGLSSLKLEKAEPPLSNGIVGLWYMPAKD